MIIDRFKYSELLERAITEDLDISPDKYMNAIKHYEFIGIWLWEGNICTYRPHIYPQGSFRLGTLVKPINGDYDIDLVCELSIAKDLTYPRLIKTLVGNRLRDLDHNLVEGKRCWTLKYPKQDSFHMDVLPAIPENLHDSNDKSIAITDKRGISSYEWLPSNPIGYGNWFDEKNQPAFDRVQRDQRWSIWRHTSIFNSIDDVPAPLVHTPLQRVIQIMKRHRDVMYNNSRLDPKYKPISIIITTLAAWLYQDYDGLDIYSALKQIVSELRKYRVLLDNGPVDPSLNLIERTSNGEWRITNPVNSGENFADRWHEDNDARAKAFFSWVDAINRDLVDISDRDMEEAIHMYL